MRELLHAKHIVFTAAEPNLRATGLLGWVKLTVGELELDGLTVRRTREGRISLGFPERVGRGGYAHAIVRPTTNETRTAIEAQVIAELKRRGLLR